MDLAEDLPPNKGEILPAQREETLAFTLQQLAEMQNRLKLPVDIIQDRDNKLMTAKDAVAAQGQRLAFLFAQMLGRSDRLRWRDLWAQLSAIMIRHSVPRVIASESLSMCRIPQKTRCLPLEAFRVARAVERQVYI